MKAISRRLRRLEDRWTPAAETDADQRLRQRLEAGRRRLAEARSETPDVVRPPGHPSDGRQIRGPLDIDMLTEILHAGRECARLAACAEAEMASDNGN